MIIVDTALARVEREGRPIRVGMFGAGFMGRAIVRQIASRPIGIRIAAIAARDPAQAGRAFREAGLEMPERVADAGRLDARVAAGGAAVVEDPLLLARAGTVDVVLDVTGAVEAGARLAVATIAAGKHLCLMNADLDATVGPLLKRRADAAGVVYTNCDGDQPGVTMNLVRFVRGIGVRPVLCGSIKGLHDPYRTPATQAAFAARWGQNPRMVTSFADGTKMAMEQAVIANATGMSVARRGMVGPTVAEGTPVAETLGLFPLDAAAAGSGIVDYVVGAAPGPGVFVVGTIDDPVQRRFLALYKLGDGPFYCFTTPYHLCHFEVPNTIARAALFADAAIAPASGPRVDVVATAKRDLAAGDVLDGSGGFLAYGLAESAAACAADGLLPMGIAAGCRVRRAIERDRVLRYDDVELPEGRLVDRLRGEQARTFADAV
ncbi:MAG: NAD(P)-dependent oxidoreductase [Alphaproteobacteria bacterium]|nr:NAD(P)-dependent oxidoreductase [Alphaproteobacteria bacterium]